MRIFWVGVILSTTVLIISAVERRSISSLNDVVVQIEPLEEDEVVEE